MSSVPHSIQPLPPLSVELSNPQRSHIRCIHFYVGQSVSSSPQRNLEACEQLDVQIEFLESGGLPAQSAHASQPSSATQQQHKAAKQAPKQPLPPLFWGRCCGGYPPCWYCIWVWRLVMVSEIIILGCVLVGDLAGSNHLAVRPEKRQLSLLACR